MRTEVEIGGRGKEQFRAGGGWLAAEIRVIEQTWCVKGVATGINLKNKLFLIPTKKISQRSCRKFLIATCLLINSNFSVRGCISLDFRLPLAPGRVLLPTHGGKYALQSTVVSNRARCMFRFIDSFFDTN